MATEGAPIAQRSRRRLYFAHRDMDYYLSWIVGRRIFEGSDEGECLAVAGRIADGDAASWQEAWAGLAEEVEAQADRALHAGDREAARRAYLRACTYHRAPLFIMSPQDPRVRALERRLRACFQSAAALAGPPIESVQVPFQGRLLPGYFWQPRDVPAKRPTLIVAGGLETFAEDCYFMVGPAGPLHGYNVITADLPGQGTNPDQGLYFEARMELPVRALVDYTLARPEVDPNRLALFGFSWGGHIVFKGAEHEPRLGALIANPPMPDVFRAALAKQAGHSKSDPNARTVFAQIAWRFGLRISLHPGDLARRLAKAYAYLRYGRADVRRIRCPALLLAGEGEAAITLKLARRTYAQLPNPAKRLVIFTAEEGGEAHCQVDNLALPNGVMFDWLQAVFGQSAAATGS